MSQIKVVSLFSGGGLMDYGFVRAGYNVIWANDIEPAAVKAYKTNIGDHIHLADISRMRTSEIPDADVIIGGFPCQPFSFSGANEGVNDDNGKLAYQFYRMIKEKNPYAFVAENVKGITTRTHKEFFVKFVNMLSLLGYSVKYETLDASKYGVPQSRERVFIIGIRSDLNTTFNFQDIEKAPRVTLNIALKNVEGLPNHENTLKYFSPRALYGGLKRGGKGGTYGMRIQEWHSTSNTLRSHIAKDGIDFIHPECGLSNKVLSYLYAKKEDKSVSDLQYMANEIYENFNPRRLSVRECLRIQSVPDEYYFIDDSTPLEKAINPDLEIPITGQYKIVGNGVPTLLAEKVARTLSQKIKHIILEKKSERVPVK
ncbi:DNA cytosine methyltransferase [Neobacillus bataviensis]|uniref:DNA cytosine methyltransferase n=1 Tax=Neobacillus bataviensis TaxID=220685 RepID=UPI001CBF671B|nr:DNA cytosine methyltransferase [Neobacillus bataviensis]